MNTYFGFLNEHIIANNESKTSLFANLGFGFPNFILLFRMCSIQKSNSFSRKSHRCKYSWGGFGRHTAAAVERAPSLGGGGSCGSGGGSGDRSWFTCSTICRMASTQA
jgi:hypothetical protein